jgi:hypothetical protein
MRTKKFLSGIELGKNGSFKNFVTETLSDTPDALEAGRIWFDSVDGVFKSGQKDEDGNTVVVTLGSGEAFDDFKEELASQDVDLGTGLVGYVGHDGANDKFSLPTGTLQASIDSLVDGVDADRKVIESNLDSTTALIQKVQDELDITQTGSGLEEDGTYAANTETNYLGEATSLKDATELLDTQAKVNADAIAQETTDREQADADAKTYADDTFLNKVTDDEQVIKAKVTMESDLYVKGDVTFNGGSITEIVTEQMKVADNIVTLNSDVADDADPTENAGIEINRGSEGIMPFIQWDETDDVAKVVTGKDSDGNYIMDTIAVGGNADAIQDELDATQVGAGLDEDGNYVVNTDANYISDATSLTDADNKLDTKVKENADTIAKEISDRSDSEDALQKELDDTQTGAGLDVDGSYVANTDMIYIGDASSIVDATEKLDTQAKVNADAITQEISDRETSISEIRSEVNSTRFIYEATDADTSYTIEHNLGTDFIDVTTWVYDDSAEKWVNDDVAISIEDTNTIQVDLTDAAKIRVVVTNMEYSF